MGAHQFLHLVFGIFGNATGLFLFLSPMVTCTKIIKNKSTLEFSGIPYNMALLNCMLSFWYGLPLVSPHNALVCTINGAGAALEAAYVGVFLAYAPTKAARGRALGLLALVLLVFAGVALVSVLALHGERRRIFCGVAAAIFSICMYGSPLSAMSLVIRTKSVEYMPFLLSLFSFLCGTSWFVFGLLGRDPFITVPNGVGSALGAVQLLIYAVYRNSTSSITTETNDTVDADQTSRAKPQLPRSLHNSADETGRAKPQLPRAALHNSAASTAAGS